MKKLSIIIVVLLSTYGCQKIHCPAFPTDLNYFPYTEGQNLKFANFQHDIHSFITTKKYNSKGEAFEWNCKCVCVIESQFRASDNQGLDIQACLSFIGRSTASNGSLDFNISSGENFFIKLFQDKEIPYKEIGKHLSDTIFGVNGIAKVVIVKGKGLVSYTTVDGEEWKLVE